MKPTHVSSLGLSFAILVAAEDFGSKTLRPDANGVIALTMDKQTLSENPTVSVSDKPLKVSVDF